MKSLGVQKFGQFTADLPEFDNPGVEIAQGLLPALSGFRSLPSLEQMSSGSTDSRVLGGIGLRDDIANLPFLYVGDAGKLYSLISRQFVNVSIDVLAQPDPDAHAPYVSDPPAIKWSMVQWENTVYATNGIYELQVITAGGQEFVNAITSPAVTVDKPKGRQLAVVREFLVMGDIVQGVGEVRHSDRVQWSGFNEPDFWEFSATKLSDFQDLRGDGGAIQAITSGSEALIFQERNIWRMTFVGAPQIFRFDLAEENLGTSAPGSVVRFQDDVYFLAADGFRKMNVKSGQSVPIGEERVDRWTLRRINDSALNTVSAEVWPEESCVVWAVPVNGETPDTLLIYNYISNRWTYANEAVDLLLQVARTPTTIEELQQIFSDPPVPVLPPPDDPGTGMLEDIPGSLDDPIWAGGPFRMGAIDSLQFGATFSGVPGRAVIRTGEAPIPGRAMVTYIRPLIDFRTRNETHPLDTVIRVRVHYRANQSSEPIRSTWVTMNSEGLCPLRVEGRYFSTVVEIEGAFGAAVGLEPYGGSTGQR